MILREIEVINSPLISLIIRANFGNDPLHIFPPQILSIYNKA